MPKPNPSLEWCIVRLGEDQNWWVDEISDEIHWDVDALSIIDPRQVDYLLELIDPLRDYGFDPDLFENAFIPFRIDKAMDQQRIRLVRIADSLLESEDKLFGLPDVIDDESGPFADLIDHLIRLRVKMLNDVMDFEQKLSVDEVEEEIRDIENNDFLEGKAVHLFDELVSVLDYMPAGFEMDEEAEETAAKTTDEEEDFPDIDTDEDAEELKGDSSLRWDEDEDEDDFDSDDEKEEDEDEDEEEDDSDEEEAEEDDPPPQKRRRR